MDITLQEFLRRKGAIGLLSLLHERPMTYSEIEPEIEVTSDTIITRRDEAAELGLLNISLGEAENGTKKVYHLTDMGEFLTDKMAREGLISNYRKMRTLEELVDEQTDALVGWVKDNPSQLLQFEEVEDGTILQGSVPVPERSDTDSNTSDQDGELDTKDIENNRTDSLTEPPQRPSERISANDTETDGNSEDADDDRPQKPSDVIPDEVKDRDTSKMTQGSLSDVEAAESEDDANSED